MATFQDASTARTRDAFGPRQVLVDLAAIVLAIAGSSLAVWGIATASPTMHRGFLFLLVIVPYVAVLCSLLRRHCYPNTRVWRSGTISPLDPIPAPMGRKLYVALLSGAEVALTLLLAFVILSRTWNAANVGPPQTTFLYDVLHPWSLAPLAQVPVGAPQGQAGAAAPMQLPWWMLPSMGLIFPLITLGWCGTLEQNSRPGPLAGYPAELETPRGRVTALLSLLLFWLPLIGLLIGFLACRWNRPARRWLYRASQVALAASLLIHAALVGLFVMEILK
jgi:hypothetical protein